MHRVLPALLLGVSSQVCAGSQQNFQHRVPGVFETCASALWPVSRLIREDLPTLERPITANSGNPSFGH